MAKHFCGGLRDQSFSKVEISGPRNVWGEVVFFEKHFKKKFIFILQKYPGSQMSTTASET